MLGGTGKTGRRVAELLRRRGIGARAASRSGPVRFDWTDEGSWDPALAGVRAVYVVDSQTAEAPGQVTAFAKAARERGVERLVLLSARTLAELDDGSGELLATERAVRESGLAWTILRPAWFSQNFTEEPWFSVPLAEGELRVPTGGGHEPFIDLDDLAEVAVAALTEDGHASETYSLSGPRALTFREAVAGISAATGRPITYTPVDHDTYVAEQTARGYSRDFAELMARFLAHIAADGSAVPGDGVRRALGREAKGFGEWVEGADFSGLGG
ncbi:NAD(P)H-binding protein [Streptomyces sp. NPDC001985]|uniref:NAD(P)H-binding protein n=1 Tax=Streptomyces sp. NPDC001985 TaxID=3154406 RepID=UPI00332ECF0D